jgi:hypothetical protein
MPYLVSKRDIVSRETDEFDSADRHVMIKAE